MNSEYKIWYETSGMLLESSGMRSRGRKSPPPQARPCLYSVPDYDFPSWGILDF
jgi:hypothetical protein